MRTRVLVVEDSPTVRVLLLHILGSDPRLEVVGAAETGEQALQMVEKLAPDVISLDIRLPGIDGFEVTREVMTNHPTPIVVLSSSIQEGDLNIAMNALRAGALSVLEKPAGTGHEDYAQMAERLCNQLVSMSQVKVVRQRLRRPAAPAPQVNPALPRPQAAPVMLGIVASTGGPNALSELLSGLENFPLPILLVQHMTPSFIEPFARWLQSVTRLPVKLAADGDLPEPGSVYLAPASRHLVLNKWRLQLRAGPPVSAQLPSGTVLLESMASQLGPAATGLILTGMGDDGAAGLLKIRQAGGYTLAQDEESSTIYGMPAAAAALGAVCATLPLTALAPRLWDLVKPHKP